MPPPPASGAAPTAQRVPRHHGPPRLSLTPDLLAVLAARLTARDRWLLRVLHEHKVLTTTQITQLAFGTNRAATGRLLRLYQHQAVDRFRPLAITGSAPWHFVLGPAGAQLLAAEDAITISQLGYRRDRALAVALSPQLAHTTGVNGFFAHLAARARAAPGSGLDRWWSERRCTALWGDLARPDAYGRWHETSPATGIVEETEFFLEYDTGTEDLPRLIGKLDGYQALADRTGIITPVLFWLPGPRRETAFHDRLTAASLPRSVPVATATPAASAAGPVGPAWLAVDRTGPRIRLASLTAAMTGTSAISADRPLPEPAGTGRGAELPWHVPPPAPPLAPRYRHPGR